MNFSDIARAVREELATAALVAVGSVDRSALVKKQLRDRKGRWIEMGDKLKWKADGHDGWFTGTASGIDGEYAVVSDITTPGGGHLASAKVHNDKIEIIDEKATLDSPSTPDAPHAPEAPNAADSSVEMPEMDFKVPDGWQYQGELEDPNGDASHVFNTPAGNRVIARTRGSMYGMTAHDPFSYVFATYAGEQDKPFDAPHDQSKLIGVAQHADGVEALESTRSSDGKQTNSYSTLVSAQDQMELEHKLNAVNQILEESNVEPDDDLYLSMSGAIEDLQMDLKNDTYVEPQDVKFQLSDLQAHIGELSKDESLDATQIGTLNDANELLSAVADKANGVHHPKAKLDAPETPKPADVPEAPEAPAAQDKFDAASAPVGTKVTVSSDPWKTGNAKDKGYTKTADNHWSPDDAAGPNSWSTDKMLQKEYDKSNAPEAPAADVTPDAAPETPDAPAADVTPEAPAAPETPQPQSTNGFDVLEDTGDNGDGYYAGTHQWGKYGAAGVMIRHTDEHGVERYLMVQRGPLVSTNKGKWQLPGGALNSKENDLQGTARELQEELAPPDGFLQGLTHAGEVKFDHPSGWHYTNIAADSPVQFDPHVDGTETGDAGWFTKEEIAKLPLHPALQANLENIVGKFNTPNAPEEHKDVTPDQAAGLSDEAHNVADAPETSDPWESGTSVGGGSVATINGEPTDDEMTALEDYTQHFYKEMNGALRDPSTTPMSPALQKEIDDLQSFIHKSQLTQDVDLYRGVKDVSWLGIGHSEELKPGTVIEDKGFLSMTHDKDLAGDFASHTYSTGAVFHYKAPAGTHGIDVDHALGQAEEEALMESEILMPHGSTFVVKSDTIDENGIHQIELELAGKDQNVGDTSNGAATGQPGGAEAPATGEADLGGGPGDGNAATDPTAPDAGLNEAALAHNGPVDISNWTKVGQKMGSNPGGTYQTPDGRNFYVKQSKSDDHARNEVLADDLYKMTGIDTSDLQLADVGNGKLGTASEMLPGAQGNLFQKLKDPAYKKKLQEGFAVDVWLQNWDVGGQEYDNVMTDKDGKPVRIDPGGALIFRAQGEPKGAAFGNDATEWDSLRNGSNSVSTNIFGDMTDDEMRASALRVTNISPEQIDAAVDGAGFDPQTTDLIKTRLKARRKYIASRAGITLPEDTTPETNAPETPDAPSAPETPNAPEANAPDIIPVDVGDSNWAPDPNAVAVIEMPNGKHNIMPGDRLFEDEHSGLWIDKGNGDYVTPDGHLDTDGEFADYFTSTYAEVDPKNYDVSEPGTADVPEPTATYESSGSITGKSALPQMGDGKVGVDAAGNKYVSTPAGDHVVKGTIVKSDTDGLEGEVVTVESNGKYVKVKGPDGKVKGRKLTTLNVTGGKKPVEPQSSTPDPAPAPDNAPEAPAVPEAPAASPAAPSTVDAPPEEEMADWEKELLGLPFGDDAAAPDAAPEASASEVDFGNGKKVPLEPGAKVYQFTSGSKVVVSPDGKYVSSGGKFDYDPGYANSLKFNAQNGSTIKDVTDQYGVAPAEEYVWTPPTDKPKIGEFALGGKNWDIYEGDKVVSSNKPDGTMESIILRGDGRTTVAADGTESTDKAKWQNVNWSTGPNDDWQDITDMYMADMEDPGATAGPKPSAVDMNGGPHTLQPGERVLRSPTGTILIINADGDQYTNTAGHWFGSKNAVNVLLSSPDYADITDNYEPGTPEAPAAPEAPEVPAAVPDAPSSASTVTFHDGTTLQLKPGDTVFKGNQTGKLYVKHFDGSSYSYTSALKPDGDGITGPFGFKSKNYTEVTDQYEVPSANAGFGDGTTPWHGVGGTTQGLGTVDLIGGSHTLQPGEKVYKSTNDYSDTKYVVSADGKKFKASAATGWQDDDGSIAYFDSPGSSYKDATSDYTGTTSAPSAPEAAQPSAPDTPGEVIGYVPTANMGKIDLHAGDEVKEYNSLGKKTQYILHADGHTITTVDSDGAVYHKDSTSEWNYLNGNTGFYFVTDDYKTAAPAEAPAAPQQHTISLKNGTSYNLKPGEEVYEYHSPYTSGDPDVYIVNADGTAYYDGTGWVNSKEDVDHIKGNWKNATPTGDSGASSPSVPDDGKVYHQVMMSDGGQHQLAPGEKVYEHKSSMGSDYDQNFVISADGTSYKEDGGDFIKDQFTVNNITTDPDNTDATSSYISEKEPAAPLPVVNLGNGATHELQPGEKVYQSGTGNDIVISADGTKYKANDEWIAEPSGVAHIKTSSYYTDVTDQFTSPAAAPSAPAPAPIPQPTGKSNPGFGGKPLWKGTKVKHPTLGEGTVVTVENNGKYVKVKLADGTIKGWSAGKLTPIGGAGYEPNSAGAPSANAPSAANAPSITTPTVPKTDPNSPWFGKPKPAEPAALDDPVNTSWTPDGWLHKITDAYPKKDVKPLQDSYNYYLVQNVVNDGNKDSLQKLFDKGTINEEHYNEALAHVNQVADVKAAELAKHVSEKAAYEKNLHDWKVANGIDAGDFSLGSFISKGMSGGVVEHDSDHEAENWWKSKMTKASTLSSAAKNGINGYVGSSFSLNRELRKKKFDTKQAGFLPTNSTNMFKGVDKAMQESSVVPEDVIVHRGADYNDWMLPDGTNPEENSTDFLAKITPGTVAKDWAFGSTSVGTGAAFASKPVQVRLRIPKGYRAVYTDSLGLPGERELILNRGTNYLVHKVWKQGHIIHVDVEIVPDGWTPAQGDANEKALMDAASGALSNVTGTDIPGVPAGDVGAAPAGVGGGPV